MVETEKLWCAGHLDPKPLHSATASRSAGSDGADEEAAMEDTSEVEDELAGAVRRRRLEF